MELCKEVPAEEYVIHVVEARTFHTHLRFSLLASSWLPRALGVCLWSVLHMILVVYLLLMLPGLFTLLLVLAILVDALMLVVALGTVLLYPLMILSVLLGVGIGLTLTWIWLVISCQCCTLPARSPGQSVARYILFGGGTLQGPITQRPPEGETAAAGRPSFRHLCFPDIFKEKFPNLTGNLFKHVALVSFPHWKLILEKLCQDIVPSYDAITV